MTAVGLEPGNIVWRCDSGGIRTRSDCVVWWQGWDQKPGLVVWCGGIRKGLIVGWKWWDHNQDDCVAWWHQNQNWLCGGRGGIRTRMIVWQYWDQKQDWFWGIVAGVRPEPRLIVRCGGIRTRMILRRGDSSGIRTRTDCWCCGSHGIRTKTNCVAWWQGWDQNQDWLCGVVGAD